MHIVRIRDIASTIIKAVYDHEPRSHVNTSTVREMAEFRHPRLLFPTWETSSDES